MMSFLLLKTQNLWWPHKTSVPSPWSVHVNVSLIISILSFFVSKQISKDFAVKSLICWFQQTVFITFLLNQKKMLACVPVWMEKKKEHWNHLNWQSVWGEQHFTPGVQQTIKHYKLVHKTKLSHGQAEVHRGFFVFVLFKHCTFLFHFFPLILCSNLEKKRFCYLQQIRIFF